jgi:hypothetical protein
MNEEPKFHSKMIKDGRWTVAVITGHGPVSHVGNFATEKEANRWIATKSNCPQVGALSSPASQPAVSLDFIGSTSWTVRWWI